MSLEPILILPDTHVPYHDKRAWDLALKVGQAIKAKHVIHLGDLADCYAISAHSKNPARTSERRMKFEVEAVQAAVREMNSVGAANRIFTEGNHEDRLPRYLADKAPDLYDLESLQPRALFGFAGWTYKKYREDHRLGKLYIVHDIGYAGRYAAQRVLDTYQHNVVSGHTHRLSYIVEGNAAGESHVSATFGWLGDARAADYMHRVKAMRDWQLGFGVGWLDTKTTHVYLQPVPIVKYKCVVGGKEYSS